MAPQHEDAAGEARQVVAEEMNPGRTERAEGTEGTEGTGESCSHGCLPIINSSNWLYMGLYIP